MSARHLKVVQPAAAVVEPAPTETTETSRSLLARGARATWELLAAAPICAVAVAVPHASIGLGLAAALAVAFTAQSGPVMVGRRGVRNIARIRSLAVLATLAVALDVITDAGARTWIAVWVLTLGCCVAALSFERLSAMSPAHTEAVANRLIRAVEGIIIEADELLDHANHQRVMAEMVQSSFAAVSGGGDVPERVTDIRSRAELETDEDE